VVGSRWGIAGAAAGVASGILFKYVAMGTLTVRLCGTQWRRYLRAQAPGFALAAFVGLTALLVRRSCEVAGASASGTLLALVGACGAGTIAGIYLLPGWLRPTELFDHLSRAAIRLPGPIRRPVRWALRCHA
jgi:hypothetical protein